MPSFMPFNLRLPSRNLFEIASTVSVLKGELVLTLSHALVVKKILSAATSSVTRVRLFHSSSLAFFLKSFET